MILSSIACLCGNRNNAPYNVGAPEMEWYVGQGTDVEEHVHEGMQTSDGGYIGIEKHKKARMMMEWATF